MSKKKLSPAKKEVVPQKFSLFEYPLWLVILIFLASTIIYFWGNIFGNYYFWEDFLRYVFPTQNFSAREFWNDGITFWNPYSFGGMPFFADLQVGFFYLFNRVLSFFLESDGFLSAKGLQIIIILHFFISQINFYFLARYFKISSLGGIFGALTYSFSLLMVLHTIHPMMIYHLSWLPLIVLFYHKALQESKIKYSTLAGLIFGLSALAGHPQTFLYEALLLGFFLIFNIILTIKEKLTKKALYQLVLGILPFLIAIGIFAVQLLPSQELASLSQREEITFEKASEGSLTISNFYTAIIPHLFGKVNSDYESQRKYWYGLEKNTPIHYYWETAFYFGVGALFLGLFIIFLRIKEPLILFFAVVSLFSLLFALGENGFLYYIFYNLPFFGNFRNPGRILFYLSFSFALLSGYSLDYLFKTDFKKKEATTFWVVSGIILFFALLAGIGVLPSILNCPEDLLVFSKNAGLMAIFFVLLFVFCFYFIAKKSLNPNYLIPIAIIICFIDLYLAGANFNNSKTSPREYYSISSELRKFLQPKLPDDIFRVNMRMYKPIPFRAMEDNQGMIDKIMLFEGYNPLILQLMQHPLKSRDRIFDLFNIRYMIHYDSLTNSKKFIERDSYLPRAIIVNNAIMTTPDNIQKVFEQNNINFHKTVVLEEKIDEQYVSSEIDTNFRAEIKCVEYQNNYQIYKYNSNRPAIAVFSEIYYPAWKAYIDGAESKIYKANYSFRAVLIPAGEHTIKMRYESEKFKNGLIISLITLACTILIFIANIFYKKR